MWDHRFFCFFDIGENWTKIEQNERQMNYIFFPIFLFQTTVQQHHFAKKAGADDKLFAIIIIEHANL